MKHKAGQQVKIKSPYSDERTFLNGLILAVIEGDKKYRISFNYESVDCVDSFSEKDVM